MKFKYKFQMYKQLEQNRLRVLAEARKTADEIGIPENLRGRIGITGTMSTCPAPLLREVAEAVMESEKSVVPVGRLVDKLRELVKGIYGDEYDAAPTNTCEAALWLAFDTLVTPPLQGRGTKYRTRHIAPYERHIHHQASYGYPFPPRYKDLCADRGVTAGELGLQGKRLENTDTVLVPLVGAKYEVHGIKYHVCPLLTGVDSKESGERIAIYSEKHRSQLAAFVSLGYDTVGYGYSKKDADETPILQKIIGRLAEEYDVPYIVDNAAGMPGIGTDPRKIQADLIMYSMDKNGLSPGGLIIGREDVMVPIRRALGMHGHRRGTVSSYGKASYVTFDPGKAAVAGQIAALRIFTDRPELLKRQVDGTHEIVKEEFDEIDPRIKDGLIITKSYNMKCVEINFENTWKNEQFGVPISTIEDMYAGTDMIGEGLMEMGIFPEISYDANIPLGPGLGTVDEEGVLIEDAMRYAAKGLVRIIEIVCKYAGVFE